MRVRKNTWHILSAAIIFLYFVLTVGLFALSQFNLGAELFTIGMQLVSFILFIDLQSGNPELGTLNIPVRLFFSLVQVLPGSIISLFVIHFFFR